MNEQKPENKKVKSYFENKIKGLEGFKVAPQKAKVIGYDPAYGEDKACEIRGYKKEDGSIEVESVSFVEKPNLKSPREGSAQSNARSTSRDERSASKS